MPLRAFSPRRARWWLPLVPGTASRHPSPGPARMPAREASSRASRQGAPGLHPEGRPAPPRQVPPKGAAVPRRCRYSGSSSRRGERSRAVSDRAAGARKGPAAPAAVPGKAEARAEDPRSRLLPSEPTMRGSPRLGATRDWGPSLRPPSPKDRTGVGAATGPRVSSPAQGGLACRALGGLTAGRWTSGGKSGGQPAAGMSPPGPDAAARARFPGGMIIDNDDHGPGYRGH